MAKETALAAATQKSGAIDKTTEEYRNFTNDVRPHRKQEWESLYHQVAVPVALNDVQTVLEFGPGRGLLGAMLKHYGLNYASSDVVDMGAKPDFNYPIMDFPLGNKYDLVCAFQTLEHNPPEHLLPHLKKMTDLSNKYVFVSLPYSGRWASFRFNLGLPGLRKNIERAFTWYRLKPPVRPLEQYRVSKTPYSHHWVEIGDTGYKKEDLRTMAKTIGLKVAKEFHSNSYPYHYFVLFEKI